MNECHMLKKIAPYLDEQLIVSEAKQVEEHFKECKSCSKEREQLLSLLQGIKENPVHTDKDDFVHGIIDAIDHPKHQSFKWTYAAAALFMVSLGIAGGFSYQWMTSSEKQLVSQASEFSPRNGNTEQTLFSHTGFMPLIVSNNQIQSIEKTTQLTPADGITFRYTNIFNKPVYFMAFAIDSATQIHWFYPAYLTESDNPKSILLENDKREEVLPDIVAPTDVTEGVLKVVVVASTKRYAVQKIETAFESLGTSDVKRIFAKDDIVKQWSVKYSK